MKTLPMQVTVLLTGTKTLSIMRQHLTQHIHHSSRSNRRITVRSHNPTAVEQRLLKQTIAPHNATRVLKSTQGQISSSTAKVMQRFYPPRNKMIDTRVQSGIFIAKALPRL